MFPKEIIDILIRYQNEYWFPQTIEEINKNIQEIYNALKDVKTYLSNELYEINSSDSIEDNRSHEILNDIQSLKEKLKSIKNFKFPTSPINVQDIKEFYDVIPDIDINSVIVLKSTLLCSAKHRTQDLTAKIPVLDKNCESYYVEVRASYCFDCQHFTILKDDFDKISDIVTCKVVDETSMYKSDESQQNHEQDNDISILKLYGYNVQTKKNISEQQRHVILSSIIEAGIMNRRQVIDLIETNMRRKSTRPDCALAVQKWKEDIEFVNTYKTEDLPKVVFDKIVQKYSQLN